MLVTASFDPPPTTPLLKNTRLEERACVHLGELGRSTAGDLLHTESGEFLLEFVELLGQVGLGLGPEFRCLDGGGLKTEQRKEEEAHQISISSLIFQFPLPIP